MNLLFTVLRAAHCRSTHHKLALDALSHLQGEQAEAWRNVLLRYHDAYFAGAKAPDDTFKDFRNHVLHPKDNYWGGAVGAAKKWYGAVLDALARHDWEDFAYDAGVLSHYYTDPWQPFHTGQSQAESNIHRAHEWSINKSYEAIYRLIGVSHGFPETALPKGSDWLATMVTTAAERSHQYYDKLVKHYDHAAGARNPVEGLDAVSRDILGRLIAQAVVGFARILERAVEEAAVDPPNVGLTLTTVLATIEVPIQYIYKRIEDGEERRAVEAAYREFEKTGKVEEHLREDDRAVRDLYAEEVRKKNAGRRALRIPPPLPEEYPRLSRGTSAATVEPTTAATAPAETTRPSEPLKPPAAPREKAKPEPPRPVERETPRTETPKREAPTAEQAPRMPQPVREEPPVPPRSAPPPQPQRSETRGEASRVEANRSEKGAERGVRFYLELDSAVVDAPSIGPKTAKRLQRLGVRTVRELLALDPESAAGKLGAKHITPQVLRDWQDQAQLVLRIPNLRGHDAQLLTACNFRSPEQVARAAPEKLLPLVLRFAESSEGQRIVRSGAPPDLEEVSGWVSSAAQARRAA